MSCPAAVRAGPRTLWPRLCNQPLMAWITWLVMSTSDLQHLAEDLNQKRCESCQRVPDQGRLDRLLGLLVGARVAVGGQVAKTADGEEEGGERGKKARDPVADAVDDRVKVCTRRVGGSRKQYQQERGEGGGAQGQGQFAAGLSMLHINQIPI